MLHLITPPASRFLTLVFLLLPTTFSVASVIESLNSCHTFSTPSPLTHLLCLNLLLSSSWNLLLVVLSASLFTLSFCLVTPVSFLGFLGFRLTFISTTVHVTSYYRNSAEVGGSSLRFSVNGRAANRETSAPCLQTSAPCLRANVHVYLMEHSTEQSEEVGTFVSNNLRMHHPYLTIQVLNEHCTVNQYCGGHNYSHTFVSYVGNDSDVLTLYVRTSLRKVLWRTLHRTFRSLRI